LSHMSCVDWIEDNEFELVFILWSYELQIQIIAKTRINRSDAKFVSLKNYWPQAETYEREIHEMYGIDFEGNDRLGEFILEDWEGTPPMRRDFDTIKYSQETYYQRPGREDAQNVRETITKHSGEEVPDFAKKYTIRKIEE
ncbi:MAG: NADH-quinone oxidoreductase subunit C, partial [Bacteroidota bacterium]